MINHRLMVSGLVMILFRRSGDRSAQGRPDSRH
jgi:hypothetical protein